MRASLYLTLYYIRIFETGFARDSFSYNEKSELIFYLFLIFYLLVWQKSHKIIAIFLCKKCLSNLKFAIL